MKAKGKAKAKVETSGTSAVLKSKGVLKRPASRSSAEPQPEPAMKKPATSGKKEVRTSKSEYKRDGVWSIKLNDKEVVRVLGLQLTSSKHMCILMSIQLENVRNTLISSWKF